MTSTLVAICFALSPALAVGSPLLSGYGGPGAGEQQIIGSTVVGGGAGGRGGRLTGGGAGPSRSRSSTGEGQSSGSPSLSGHSAGEGSPGASEAETGAGSGGAEGAKTAKSGSSATPASGRKGGNAAHRSESGSRNTQSHSGTAKLPSAALAANERPLLFGLSSGDVLLAAALFVALLLIGVLTSWLQVLERKRFGADDAHMGHSGAR